MSKTWDDERDLVLKQCVAAGHSFANIAIKINSQFGINISRNSCIGRAKRLGLSVSRTVKVDGAEHRLNRKPEGKARTITVKPRTPQFVCEPTRVVPSVVDVVPRHISIFDLTDETCKWPFGDAAPFTFCGCETFSDSPYCWPHATVAHGLGTESERQAHKGIAA